MFKKKKKRFILLDTISDKLEMITTKFTANQIAKDVVLSHKRSNIFFTRERYIIFELKNQFDIVPPKEIEKQAFTKNTEMKTELCFKIIETKG